MQSLAKRYKKASLTWRSGTAGHMEGERRPCDVLSVQQDLKADAQVIEKSILFFI